MNSLIKALGSFLIITLALLQLTTIHSGCANMIPPQGGPRDTLPPLLVSIDPRDSMTNFNEGTITLTFDEYVTLDNVPQNLLVSPTPNKTPGVTSKLNKVTVKLNDPLEQNTTYVIDFGNMIRDINESNTLRGFSYIFTTGDALDSLELEGNVVLAETGKIDTTLIVVLHRNSEDSAVINEKPRYIARLDRQGHFHFRFLPPGTYYIYAFEDKTNSRLYFGGDQLFAFLDSAIVVGPGSPPVTLYASAEKKSPVSNMPTLTQNRPGANRADDRRMRYFTNLNNTAQDLMKEFILNFEQPLKTFDSTLLTLSTDSLFNPLTGYSWSLDSTRKKLSLAINWKENTLYNLILDREFAEDTLGRKLLKTDTIRFMSRKQSEYGTVKIRFKNVDLTKNATILFLQNDQVIRTYPLTSETFTQSTFLPGEYDLRILYDTNQNGKWDPGDFFNGRRQPERVFPVERKISVRPAFENQFEIEIR